MATKGQTYNVKNRRSELVPCEKCGKPFRRYNSASYRRFCSMACKRLGLSGASHPLSAGRWQNRFGYWIVREWLVPSEYHSMIRWHGGDRQKKGTGSLLEHRLVAAQKIGRPLTKDEVVHHLDGNKTNNDPGNLEVVSKPQHDAITMDDTHEVMRLRRENALLWAAMAQLLSGD